MGLPISQTSLILDPFSSNCSNMLVGRAVNIQVLLALTFAMVVRGAYLNDISRDFHLNLANVKRAADSDRCPPMHAFRCPGDKKECISMHFFCDGKPDCPDGYDEDDIVCLAAKRPPVEESVNFLHSLILNHGPNYLEKLFGGKDRDALQPLGGMQKIAEALSVNKYLDDFGKALHLKGSDLEHLRNVFMVVQTRDPSLWKSLGIRDSEIRDMNTFMEKLVSSEILD